MKIIRRKWAWDMIIERNKIIDEKNLLVLLI